MPTCAAASICSGALMTALGYGLLLGSQNLYFSSGEAKGSICD
jgi:hypothetical protein